MITLPILTITCFITLISISKKENPISISIKLILVTINLFTIISISTRRVWFPLILIILLLGGILVIFTILSSLIPNEKIKKEKPSMIYCIFFRIPIIIKKSETTNIFKDNKTFIEERPTFIIILFIILFYFLRFVTIINKEDTPIRNFECLKIKIL